MKSCSNLQVLTLSELDMNSDMLKSLTHLSRLHTLKIWCCYAHNRGYDIPFLKSLRSFRFCGTFVSKSVETICQLELESLELAFENRNSLKTVEEKELDSKELLNKISNLHLKYLSINMEFSEVLLEILLKRFSQLEYLRIVNFVFTNSTVDLLFSTVHLKRLIVHRFLAFNLDSKSKEKFVNMLIQNNIFIQHNHPHK